MFAPDWRRHAVAEVNAFGDLLPGLLVDGRDTYAAQVAALAAGYPPRPRSPHDTPCVNLMRRLGALSLVRCRVGRGRRGRGRASSAR